MTSLADVRANVRLDLKDPSGASARWSDAELDRAIDKAVTRYSYAWPRALSVDLVPSVGDNVLTPLTGEAAEDYFLAWRAVEFPADQLPPVFMPFRAEGLTVQMLYTTTPDGVMTARFHFDALHLLTASVSSIPPGHGLILETGAAGYAAEMWAATSINRINATDDTYRFYRQLANDRITLFQRELKDLQRKRSHVAASMVAITGYEV
ncbi:MAG: hypothetical protein ACYC3S_18200 [Chloroflexota bacterium]